MPKTPRQTGLNGATLQVAAFARLLIVTTRFLLVTASWKPLTGRGSDVLVFWCVPVLSEGPVTQGMI